MLLNQIIPKTIDNDLAQRLYKQGNTTKQIADKFNVNINTVPARILNLGPNPTPQQKQIAVDNIKNEVVQNSNIKFIRGQIISSKPVTVPKPISKPIANINSFRPFKATYYNPTDPRQTKANGNGIGAFNKPVVFGDVAMGNRKYKQGALLFIKELADVKTPYGMGIFRVNDKKNIRYNDGTDSFDIAVPTNYPKAKELQNRIGNNQFSFQLLNS